MNKIWFVACTELNKAADSNFLTIKKSEEFIFQCIDVLGQRGALTDLKVMVNHGQVVIDFIYSVQYLTKHLLF